MPDPWSTITEAPAELHEQWAALLESRAEAQRAETEAYLAELDESPGARALEVGCGTGAVTRLLAARPNVSVAVGLDPSPVFIARARELAAGVPQLRFELGDGRDLAYPDASFDVVVYHTTLTHLPDVERCLSEACRVLAPGGALAIFDGDYASVSFGTSDSDPLQAVVSAFYADRTWDRYLMRRLPALLRAAGFVPGATRSWGFLDTRFQQAAAEAAVAWTEARGAIGPELAAGLRSEIARRVEEGTFFGFTGYASIIARKP